MTKAAKRLSEVKPVTNLGTDAVAEVIKYLKAYKVLGIHALKKAKWELEFLIKQLE